MSHSDKSHLNLMVFGLSNLGRLRIKLIQVYKANTIHNRILPGFVLSRKSKINVSDDFAFALISANNYL